MILLVIDMQKGIVDEDLYAYGTFMDRTLQLIDAARKNHVEVIFVQHDAGPDSGLTIGDPDFEIIDQIQLQPGEKVFVKKINSCFGNQEFKNYMKQQQDRRIIRFRTRFRCDHSGRNQFHLR